MNWHSRIEYKKIQIAALLAIAILCVSCRTQKPSTSVNVENIELLTSCYPLSSLTIPKCKLNVTTGGNSIQLSGSIFIDRDSIVYFRGSFLGLEVVRGIVLKDSFAVINRNERTCFKGSNNYLSRITGYPVNPSILMMLFTGDRCVHSYSDLGFKSVSNKNKTTLFFGHNSLEINVNPETQTTENIISKNQQTQFQANFSSYQQYTYFLLPTMIDLTAFDGKTAFRLKAEFQEILFNEKVPINFSIPKGYKMVEL